MSRVGNARLCLCCLGVLLIVLLAAWGGVARGQPMPHVPPNPAMDDYMRQLNEQAKKFQEREPILPLERRKYYPVKEPLKKPEFMEILVTSPITWCIVAGSVLLSLATRLYLNWSSTTDPHKLAQRDPWMRAYLSRQESKGAPPE